VKAIGCSRLDRQTGFNRALKNRFDIASLTHDSSAECQRLFVTDIIIEPVLTSFRTGTNQEEGKMVFKTDQLQVKIGSIQILGENYRKSSTRP